MAWRNPPGTGVLRLSAAILLIGGPILALIFRSWGVGSLVFGLGAILLGVRQVRLGEHRSERFLGVGLLLGGAFTAIEGLIRLLSGAAP
jgi:hypothetical protein